MTLQGYRAGRHFPWEFMLQYCYSCGSPAAHLHELWLPLKWRLFPQVNGNKQLQLHIQICSKRLLLQTNSACLPSNSNGQLLKNSSGPLSYVLAHQQAIGCTYLWQPLFVSPGPFLVPVLSSLPHPREGIFFAVLTNSRPLKFVTFQQLSISTS